MNDYSELASPTMVLALKAEERTECLLSRTGVSRTVLAIAAISPLGEGATADDVDWLGVGMLLRTALGWSDYPAVPER